MSIRITHFTDPACPFAFSAEPVRMRLRWHYRDQLAWEHRMIVLTLERGHAERLAGGAPTLQRQYGMPIDPRRRSRPASSEPASLAFVAARLRAPEAAEALLRRLRVRGMAGGLLDDPELIAACAREAGLDPDELARWCEGGDVVDALAADVRAARSPSVAALALDHKLGGPPSERRYAAPSYELVREHGGTAVTVPGFNPIEAYETAIANLAPELRREPPPASVGELLEWSGMPLATAEVAMIAELDQPDARAALALVARPLAFGADFYWEL